MSTERFDLEKLKARISVETVLEDLGASIPSTGFLADEVPFFCPFCDDIGSSKPAGRLNDMSGLWHCWSCNRGGDIISAVREAKGLGFNEALQYLLDTYPNEEEDVDPWGA